MVAVLAGASDGDSNLRRSSLLADANTAGELETGSADLLGSESLDAVKAVVKSAGAESLLGLSLRRHTLLALLGSSGGAFVLERSGASGEASLERAAVGATLGGREVVLNHAARASIGEATGTRLLCHVGSSLLALASLLDNVNFGVDWDRHAALASETSETETTLASLKGSAVVSDGSPASTLSVLFESSGAVLLSVVRRNIDSGALRALAATDFAHFDERKLLGGFAASEGLSESSRAELLGSLRQSGNALLALLGGASRATGGLRGLDDALETTESSLAAHDLGSLGDSLLASLSVEVEAEGT